jgi:hypothetical protein
LRRATWREATHENILSRAMQSDAVVVVAVLGGSERNLYALSKARADKAVVCDVEFEGRGLGGQDVDALFLVAFVDHAYLAGGGGEGQKRKGCGITR